MQILGGGLNLLRPVDKVPVGELLLAQNFRADRLGKLVSRLGYGSKFSIAGAGLAHSAAVYGGVNGAYYIGANDSLTAPTGKVYYNFGAVAIASGFDGNRIGFAAMNGYMWTMNQAKQGRHSAAAGWEDWNVAAPVVSAAAAAAATPGVTANVTYTYNSIGTTAVHYLTIAGVSYSFVENGYSGAQIPIVIAALAREDPNCSVTHAAGSQDVVVTPIIPNTLFAISGSDGNAAASVATGAVSSLPSGTYQYYVTFATTDDKLESNPGPASAAVTVTSQAVTLTAVPVSSDARVGKRNIYATGGTLGQPYLVGTINDNVTTTITISLPDLEATNNGVVMATNHDAPPAAAGVIGPHFSRLYAWNTIAHPNRLFVTDPNLPQYWPGSADPVGNWVDVGAEGEAIVWCTIHSNLLVIYKERSIWLLIGDWTAGNLVCVTDTIGLAGQFALAEAGAEDYFVASNGLRRFDMDRVHEVGANVAPLFNANSTNLSATNPPGSIKLASAYNSTSNYPYAVALGYGLGKLYIGYAEQASATRYCLLVYHEESDRWFYHRNTVSGATGFFGFVFDGVQMVGLTGSAGGAALGLNLDDFRNFYTQDSGPVAIECVYQSHYEDCGLPDSQKVWLEVAVDYEFAGDSASLEISLDNGSPLPTLIATLTGSTRKTVSYPLAMTSLGAIAIANPADTSQKPCLARNLAVTIQCSASALAIIHNVYLYYYEEARLAASASTIPTDLGSPRVKQCKELQLDIDPSSGGPVSVQLYSDLPGNQLAVRQTPTVAAAAGRGVWKYPFAVTEGFLWRLVLTGTASFPFRLYSARLLMRTIGVYVEAYEAAAGFVWDSMEQTFDDGVTHIQRQVQIAIAALPVKRAREISFEIDTFGGNVTLTFLSDLPGNAMTSRFTSTINTGTAGRRFWRIPLPAGILSPIEGRMFRIQLSGASKFILYEAAVELLPIGVYVESYEAAGGAVYDSRELDGGTPQVKEARELELDIETFGLGVTATVTGILSDVSTTITATATATGRQKVLIPLTVSAAAELFLEGHLLRLILSGTHAFALYGARLRVRPFGTYLVASESSGGALWDTTDLDLGTQTVKQLREVELELWAYGAYTVTVYTDLPGNAMSPRTVSNQAQTTGRTKVRIPMPQGAVPDNYQFGRLVRVTITSSSAFKLFGARIHARPIGVYVESYEAAGGAVWDSTPTDLGSPNDKTFDEVRFEMDSDGAANVAVYTDLPGESFTSKGTYALTTGGTSRHWATVPLPAGVEGRSIRLVVSSVSGFRIYKAQVRSGRVGRYLCAATPAGNDALTTLEFDFASERVKLYKKIEIDLRADGNVNLTVITNQSGALATFASPVIATPNGRETLTVVLPPGARGRLLRIAMTSSGAARIYHVRVWTRPVNEPNAAWAWVDYPLEESDVLPAWSELAVEATPPGFTWSDLPVGPTPPEWGWVPCPVNPTEAQPFWAKVLSVDETSDKFEFVDVPFEVVGGD